MPELRSLYVSECPGVALGSLLCKDSLERLTCLMKLEASSGHLVHNVKAEDVELDLVDGRPKKETFIEVKVSKRENLVRISYDMEYLYDFYVFDQKGHTESTTDFGMEIGMALEFIHAVKAMRDHGHAVLQDPSILQMICDMEAFLWRGRMIEQPNGQSFLEFLRQTLREWPVLNVPELDRYHVEEVELADFLFHYMGKKQKRVFNGFWKKFSGYVFAAAGDYSLPGKPPRGQPNHISYCREHGFVSGRFFPSYEFNLPGISRFGGPQCFQCRYREVRFAYETAAYPQRLLKASPFQALDTVCFADRREIHLEAGDRLTNADSHRPKVFRNHDGALQVPGFAKNIIPDFLDTKKLFRRPAPAVNTGKACMYFDLASALVEVIIEHKDNPEPDAQQHGASSHSDNLDIPGYMQRYNRIKSSWYRISYHRIRPRATDEFEAGVAKDRLEKGDVKKQMTAAEKKAEEKRRDEAIKFASGPIINMGGHMTYQAFNTPRYERKMERIPDSHIVITDSGFNLDRICPLSINSEGCIYNCEKLKPCAAKLCRDPRCRRVHKMPCPRFVLRLGYGCYDDCDMGDHRGYWLEACTAERSVAHEKEFEQRTDEAWLEAVEERRRTLEIKFVSFLT